MTYLTPELVRYGTALAVVLDDQPVGPFDPIVEGDPEQQKGEDIVAGLDD